MSYLWKVIEEEMEALKADACSARADTEFVLAQLDAMRTERDEFAGDVMRMAKVFGYSGPMRGKSSR